MTSSDIDGDLRAVLSSPMTAGQRRSLDSLLRDRLERPAGRSIRLRPRGVVLVLAVVLIAAPSFFIVSAGFRTTEDPNGPASAAAFQAEIDAAKAVVPLPPGRFWPAYLVVRDHSASYSAGGGRTWVEFVAFCAWTQDWLSARASGSTASSDADAAVILGASSWEFYQGEFSSDSDRAAIDRVVAGVRSGDTGPVQSFVSLNCDE